MNNRFVTNGKVTTIFLTMGAVATIDTSDLPTVSQFSSWSAAKRSNGIYAVGRMPKAARTQLMHRVLTNAQKGLVVDHMNHDTLDNRKCNLRVVTHSVNMQNLRGAHQNNSTRFRNVCEFQSRNWKAYRVQIGTSVGVYAKYFPKTPAGLEQAVEHAEMMRGRLMPSIPKSGKEVAVHLTTRIVVEKDVKKPELAADSDEG